MTSKENEGLFHGSPSQHSFIISYLHIMIDNTVLITVERRGGSNSHFLGAGLIEWFVESLSSLQISDERKGVHSRVGVLAQ